MSHLWYTGLIRSNPEYCAALLFSRHNYVQNELLRTQSRCIKIIERNSSKQNTRLNQKLPSIITRMKYLYLITFFKLTNCLVPIIDNSLLPRRSQSITRHVGLGEGRSRFSLDNFGAGVFNALRRQSPVTRH